MTLEYINSGRGHNFNAILYKGLSGEWEYTTSDIAGDEIKLLEKSKKKWLSYFAGIMTDKNLKDEVKSIIRKIPIEMLNENKKILARMNTFEFKQHLLSLGRRC